MIYIDSFGDILCKGDNMFGALGLGNLDNTNHYTKAFLYHNYNVRFTNVSSSGLHSVALDEHGRLWSTGNNECGQLGLGDNVNRFCFILVNIKDKEKQVKFVSVYCGLETTLAIDSCGNLWGCGENKNGELGLGHNVDVNIFHKIEVDTNPMFNSLSQIYDCTVALDDNGNIWATGDNKLGLLGLGHYHNVSRFVKVDLPVKVSLFARGNKNTLLDVNGDIWICGSYERVCLPSYVKLRLQKKFNFKNPKKILDVGVIIILDEHDKLWCITNDNVKEIGDNLMGIVDIVSHEGFLMVQCDDGSVFSENTSNLFKCCASFKIENLKVAKLVSGII